MSSGGDRGASGPTRGAEPHRRARMTRTFIAWWVLGFALWLLLDDTAALPELVDGGVAATLAAASATGASAAVGPALRPPSGWARHGWRPVAALVGDLPRLIGVLFAALRTGQRDPGRLRTVSFTPAGDPGARAGQVALATFAGSVAPTSIVVAVDCERGQMLVHELVPRTGRQAADPLGVG